MLATNNYMSPEYPQWAGGGEFLQFCDNCSCQGAGGADWPDRLATGHWMLPDMMAHIAAALN